MVKCNNCSLKIGIFSKKNYVLDKVYCGQCYPIYLKEEQLEKAKEQILLKEKQLEKAKELKIKRAKDLEINAIKQKKEEEIRIINQLAIEKKRKEEEIALEKKSKEKEKSAFEAYKRVSDAIERSIQYVINAMLENPALNSTLMFIGSIKFKSSYEIEKIVNLSKTQTVPRTLFSKSIEFYNDEQSLMFENQTAIEVYDVWNDSLRAIYCVHIELSIGNFSADQLHYLKQSDISIEDMMLFIFNDFSDECRKITGRFIGKTRNEQIELELCPSDEKQKMTEEEQVIIKHKEAIAFEAYKAISSKIITFIDDIMLDEEKDTTILFYGSIKFKSSKDIDTVLNYYGEVEEYGASDFLHVISEGNYGLKAQNFMKRLINKVEFYDDVKSLEARRMVEYCELDMICNLFGTLLSQMNMTAAMLEIDSLYEQFPALIQHNITTKDMLLFIFNDMSDLCRKRSGRFISKTRNELIQCDISDLNNDKTKLDVDDIEHGQLADFIKNYLSNRTEDQFNSIKMLYLKEDNSDYYERNSLSALRERCDIMMTYNQSKEQAGLSLDEIDEVSKNKRSYGHIYEFLDDLVKIQKVFSKKNIYASYHDIHTVFLTIIQDETRQKLEVATRNLIEVYIEPYLSPIVKHIIKNIGPKYDKGSVGSELYRYYNILKYVDCFPDPQIQEILTHTLQKLDLSYTIDELNRIFEQFKKDYDLDEFERTFGNNKKVVMGDFENLDGYQFEKYLSQLFRYMGYAVYETPPTGDQGADLVLSKSGQKAVVQAKKYSDKVTNKAIQEVFTAKAHYKADKAMVVTNSFFTDSAIQLALSNDVELWDNTILCKAIKNLTIQDNSNTLQSLLESYSIFEDGKQRINIFCPLCDGNIDLYIQNDQKCPICEFPVKGDMKVKICQEASVFKED
jgi:HJR/Mrr/RecB family endonuclease